MATVQQLGHQNKSRGDNDPKWAAVDEYGESHLTTERFAYHEALEYTKNIQVQEGLPNIAVSPLQGKFLMLQCMLIRAKNALEVGTLAGYSSIWMAASSDSTRVTTVEFDEHHKAVAEKAFAHANLSDRIQCIGGSGVDVLPRLRKEVDLGQRDKFDFVFIDADKENNMFYLQEAVEMCRPGACIIVDNVVRRGNVASEEAAKADSRVAGSRKVIEGAGADARLECTMIQMVGAKMYDGFMVCIVK